MMNFQHHYTSFQCHMIFQKSKSANLMLKKHLLLLSLIKTVVFLNICTYILHFFSGFSDEQIVQKNNIYLK